MHLSRKASSGQWCSARFGDHHLAGQQQPAGRYVCRLRRAQLYRATIDLGVLERQGKAAVAAESKALRTRRGAGKTQGNRARLGAQDAQLQGSLAQDDVAAAGLLIQQLCAPEHAVIHLRLTERKTTLLRHSLPGSHPQQSQQHVAKCRAHLARRSFNRVTAHDRPPKPFHKACPFGVATLGSVAAHRGERRSAAKR